MGYYGVLEQINSKCKLNAPWYTSVGRGMSSKVPYYANFQVYNLILNVFKKMFI